VSGVQNRTGWTNAYRQQNGGRKHSTNLTSSTIASSSPRSFYKSFLWYRDSALTTAEFLWLSSETTTDMMPLWPFHEQFNRALAGRRIGLQREVDGWVKALCLSQTRGEYSCGAWPQLKSLRVHRGRRREIRDEEQKVLRPVAEGSQIVRIGRWGRPDEEKNTPVITWGVHRLTSLSRRETATPGLIGPGSVDPTVLAPDCEPGRDISPSRCASRTGGQH
jgi:hypothetical protein